MAPSYMLSGLTSWIGGREKIHFDFYEEHNLFGDSIQMTVQNKNKNLQVYEARIREPSEIFMTGFQGIPKGAKAVLEFLAWARENQVRVFATYPNLAKNHKYTSEERERVTHQIKEIYLNFNVQPISSPEDSMFDQSLFYNTNYHMLIEGVAIRSNKIIKILK
jgi:hypothetical protein